MSPLNARVEILSDWIPRDMDRIGEIMREEGMLQRYPAINQW